MPDPDPEWASDEEILEQWKQGYLKVTPTSDHLFLGIKPKYTFDDLMKELEAALADSPSIEETEEDS